MRRIINVLACHSLAAVIISPLAQLQADDSFAVPSSIANVLQKHCLDCHGDESAEGGVRLDLLAKLGKDERFALLNRVQEQLYFNLMPPKTEAQPSDQDRQQVVDWITSAFAEAGQESALKSKMQKPQYGNYVDHDKLFSGEIKDAPFSPARLWRHSPHQFEYSRIFYLGEPKRETLKLGAGKRSKFPMMQEAKSCLRKQNNSAGSHMPRRC